MVSPPLPPLQDEDVIRRIRAGEPLLFEMLMRRNNERVYRAVRALLRDQEEIADVMQEAYIAAFVHLDQFEGRAAFSTWLIRIALNEARRRLRSRDRMVMISGLEEAMEHPARDDPEHNTGTKELARLVEDAIDALPDAQREVFVLREVEGMSTAEIAECLELNEEAVRVRLHRAKNRIRSHLSERADEASKEAFRFLRPRCDKLVAAVLSRIS